MWYRTLIIFVLLGSLVACNATQEEPSSTASATNAIAANPATVAPTATQPPEEPATATAAAVEETQTEDPPSTATAEDVAPTEISVPTATTEVEATDPPPPSSTEAIPESTSTPKPALAPPLVEGTAGFQNNLATADKFILDLTGVSVPPDGQLYQGWLVSDDGATISVGNLSVGANGTVALTWNSPNGENLFGQYSRFQATLEPAAGSNAPTGPVVFAGSMDPDALLIARRLFVKNEAKPATPRNTAFALGLVAQTDIATQHVQNAGNAAAIGALPEMRTHLEHVINIIEGATGPRFGDHDGSGNAQNPGDGFGVVSYTNQISSLLAAQPAVVEAATGVQTQASTVEDKAFEIFQLDDMAAANAQLVELTNLTNQLKTESVAKLYQAAQNAVAFEITAAE